MNSIFLKTMKNIHVVCQLSSSAREIKKAIPQSLCNSKTSRLAMPPFGPTLVMLLSLASLAISCTEHESNSLLQFLTGLSKDSGLSKSWQNGTDCCTWEGIGCSRDKTVNNIFLARRSLQGFISPILGNLTGLLRLNLSYNLLSGDLPMELLSSSSIIILDVSFNQLNGDLHEIASLAPSRPLEVLNISSNLFSGQFTSTTWKGMMNLIVLNISNNSFTGQIPTHFCNISPSFAVFELCYNQFSSTVPKGLGNCSMLTVLNAGHNHLSGAVPNELFNSTSLEYLSFANNNLNGVLDGVSISNLRNLVTLDLGGNSFSGRIPNSIGQLKRLEELHLDDNSMYGELPSTLSNCTGLKTITLQNNSFGGELTKVNFSDLPNLKILDLLQNNFSGRIPESIYSCSKLTAIRLSSNKFHGQLSKGLGNLKSLAFLSLYNNSLSNITNALEILSSSKNLTTLLLGINFMNETMPENVGIDGFENLQVLKIRHCLLAGKIPLWIASLEKLEILFLNGNRLTGPIPNWINTLNYLFYVDLSNNSLTGDIPTALMNMPMLTLEKTAGHLYPRIFELPVYAGPSRQYRISTAFPKMLNLSSNKFTGVIPQEISQLKALIYLDISFNKLTGPIPPSICNLTSLQVLDLSNNNLTGEIPVALENLHFLSIFNVSGNNLEGPIPTGGQFNTFQNSSFDGNPKLCGPTLDRHCNSTEKGPMSIVYSKLRGSKVIFAIAFGVFLGLGVLYDQMVLSRYFG